MFSRYTEESGDAAVWDAKPLPQWARYAPLGAIMRSSDPALIELILPTPNGHNHSANKIAKKDGIVLLSNSMHDAPWKEIEEAVGK